MIELLEESLAIWRDCPADLPEFDHCLSASEQSSREPQLERLLNSVRGQLHRPPTTTAERQSARERMTGAFADFGRTALGLEDRHLEILLEGGLLTVGTELARQARCLDAGVSLEDILQANRNAWTACGLQKLFGTRMSLTPAIFAYSMLYPYTDNYMDDPANDARAKQAFSVRFGCRLAGHPIPAESGLEKIIWRLIELIEGQYSRAEYPQVFESLLRIHSAQENSIRLLRGGRACGNEELLRLGFEKGGASVLADGYLAAGSLTPEQARFVFHWGVLLQLADDLQDVLEDRRNGVVTLFSQASSWEPLDGLTNRTLQFGRRVMLMMHGLPGTDCLPLKQLIEKSCLSLVIRSAGEAGDFYTRNYLEEIETHSPFRFSFLKEKRREFAGRGGLVTKLFEAYLVGDSGY